MAALRSNLMKMVLFFFPWVLTRAASEIYAGSLCWFCSVVRDMRENVSCQSINVLWNDARVSLHLPASLHLGSELLLNISLILVEHLEWHCKSGVSRSSVRVVSLHGNRWCWLYRDLRSAEIHLLWNAGLQSLASLSFAKLLRGREIVVHVVHVGLESILDSVMVGSGLYGHITGTALLSMVYSQNGCLPTG